MGGGGARLGCAWGYTPFARNRSVISSRSEELHFTKTFFFCVCEFQKHTALILLKMSFLFETKIRHKGHTNPRRVVRAKRLLSLESPEGVRGEEEGVRKQVTSNNLKPPLTPTPAGPFLKPNGNGRHSGHSSSSCHQAIVSPRLLRSLPPQAPWQEALSATGFLTAKCTSTQA